VSFFTDDELSASGLDPALLRAAGNMCLRGVFSRTRKVSTPPFSDSSQGSGSHGSATPVFLEACWEALERAATHRDGSGERGIFAGATFNTYYEQALLPRPGLLELIGHEQ